MLQRLLGVALEYVEIIQWIGGAESAGVDQAHEPIAQPGAVLSLIAQGVFPVENGHFECAFADIVIQGRTGLAPEQGQGVPVFEPVAQGLTQSGVRFHQFLLQPLAHPLVELVHDFLTALLVEPKPGFGGEPGFLGLGLVWANLAQVFQHVLAFLREVLGHVHNFRLPDLDREHAMIPGKRLGTFRRVTGKAARWILRGDQTIPRGIKTQSGSTMPPLLLQGFPDGAIRIGSTLRVLKKEGRVTDFVGSDSYFSQPENEAAGQRFAMATLLANGHVRASEVEVSGLGIAPRTLMHWTRQLDPKGPGSFYAPRPGRGGAVMTPEKMEAEPQEAGYLYVDGHVRVYHGSGTLLPRRYVSAERLGLRGRTEYGINDALGRPFFVVSKAATDGLAATLLEEIVPELLASVAAQRIGGRTGRRSAV